jgi:hypothetical protein
MYSMTYTRYALEFIRDRNLLAVLSMDSSWRKDLDFHGRFKEI